MSTKTIHSGQTLTVSLALAGTGNLIVQGGYPGKAAAYAILSGSGTVRTGQFILAQGGLPAYAGASPRLGGTIALGGTLVNQGVIDVAGGLPGTDTVGGFDPGGGGGLFKDRGVLSNSGLLIVEGGVSNGPYTASQSGSFDLVGVLTNTGTIDLAVGAPRVSMGAGSGGVLQDSGTLTNKGLISIEAATPGTGYGFYGSAGISIAASGTLTNSATILLAGGLGATTLGERRTGGGAIYCKGVLNNSGVIVFGGGGPGLSGYYGELVGYGSGMTVAGVLMNSGTIVLGGGAVGTAAQPSGGGAARVNINLYASATNSGTIIVAGGAGGIDATSLGGGGAIFSVYGNLTNTGLITCQAGASPAVTGGHAGADAFIEIGISGRPSVLTNAGTILLSENAAYPTPYLDYDATIGSGDELLLANGGKVLGNGTILNFGSLTGTGTVSGGGLINDSSNTVGTGMALTIDEQITGRGTFTVLAGATLNLAGSITVIQNATLSEYQTVVLDKAGVLTLTSGTAQADIISPSGGTVTLLGGGTATLYATDTDLSVNLAQATTLTLSKAAFVTAIGSTGADTITAQATRQTITGGLGTDTLTGSTATGDTFMDTAAGLNTDSIARFAGSDRIDLTDIAPGAGLTLSYSQGSGAGTLSVSNAGTTANIILLGSFSQSQFTTASDGHGGVFIGLHG